MILDFLGGLLVDLVVPYRVQIAFWLVVIAALFLFIWLGS